jgi:hypothetical protein
MISAVGKLARRLLSLVTMSVNAPTLSALCAALLLALVPARADATGVLTPLPLAWQRSWSALPKLELTPPRRLNGLNAVPDVARPHLALTLDRGFAPPWTSGQPLIPLWLELGDRSPNEDASAGDEPPAGLRLPRQVPPLIRYSDETTDVTLSISPGSPCTGACLKLAGSF